MTVSVTPEDPGNADPSVWLTPFTDAELAALLGLVDNPSSPLVVAGLAGTLYDDPALDQPLSSDGGGNGH